jgi:hypothetical protein
MDVGSGNRPSGNFHPNLGRTLLCSSWVLFVPTRVQSSGHPIQNLSSQLRTSAKLRQIALLLLLTAAAILVHGYHPYVEDAEIYLPGIEKRLNPALFPYNTQFFLSHANATWFPSIVAASIRISHLPFSTAIFLWHLATIFLFLWGLWELSGRCFTDRTARWAGVCLVATLFTIPVAGTALYIFDQYFNPRNLTAGLGMFSLVKVLDKKYFQALLLLVLMAGLHPLMAVFVFGCSALVILLDLTIPAEAALALLGPLGLTLQPPPPEYRQVAATHRYHYLLQWEWYELLGAVAPIAILWWFTRLARKRNLRHLDLLCRALIIMDIASLLLATVLSSSVRFESLARIQPMRSLHLLYILMFLFVGGFLGEFVLQRHLWRWLVLFVPLCAGMFYAQLQVFPTSAHIEWPWAQPKNSWVQAFLWVRTHTPTNSFFALDPYHMAIDGEDQNGFRALAERSMLADAVKDSGAVTMFPPLAVEWVRQFDAQKNWKHFELQDFERLKSDYGVNWIIVQQPGVPGLVCPYQNSQVLVCQVP